MSITAEPAARLDGRFSSPAARPTRWTDALRVLQDAQVYWLTTVRRDGRPHVTPLIAVWLDDALYFCTGEGEQKFKNIEANAHCAITTGCNKMDEGLDVIIESEAAHVGDESLLRRLAEAYVAKYGDEWRFTVRDGTLVGAEGNVARVFRLAPDRAFGFARGATYSQTRWGF
jgi:uncharacterized pyridoxamine 5'-phosphate oxidase family protein